MQPLVIGFGSLVQRSMLMLTLLFGQMLPLVATNTCGVSGNTCDPAATSEGSALIQRQKSILKNEFGAGDADTYARDQATQKLDKLMLPVDVNSANEFVDTMTSTGFSMETLASYMESPKSTVEDGDGKVHKWSDFVGMHPSQATAKFPLKFRIDTAHQSTRTHNRPDLSLEQSQAMIEQFNAQIKDKASDPAFLAQIARKKEDMKKHLRTNLSKHQLYDTQKTMEAVVKGLDVHFVEKCGAEEVETQDCAEYRSCMSMTEDVFGESQDFQHPTDEQVQQLITACNNEVEKVRADIAGMNDTEQEEFGRAADEILPKCRHVGKTMRAYLGSLGEGSVKTRSQFCAYMINYVFPVDKEPPCQRFLELVKAEWMTISGKNINWPAITQDESFDAAFQKACKEDGATHCEEGLTQVKSLSADLIEELTSTPLNPTKTDDAVKLAEKETQYHEQVCLALGYEDPAITKADVLQLRQRHTVRAANALKFMQGKTKILMAGLAMATLVDCALNEKAYYHNVNVAAGSMAADVGAGYGFYDKEWIWFTRYARVKTAMFASVCNMISTGVDAEAGVGTGRFSNYGDIAGFSVTFTVGGSIKGVGGEAGVIFCCGNANQLPGGSGCRHCGITVSPAFDAEGNDVSAGLLQCQTWSEFELGPAWIPPPIEVRNPFCFPGKALVQTPSGGKTMSDLRVGDRVLTVGSDNSLAFEDVYFFGHADQYTTATYVGLQVGNDVLHLSGDHFVPLCRSHAESCIWEQRIEVYAREVKVGDVMWVKNSASFSTSKVNDVFASQLSGIFNPYTISGNIIVNGVVASCHSSWILDSLFPKRFQPWIPAVYQAVFLPGRWIYKLFGVAAADFLDMNNPQASPETFGFGPIFALVAHGVIPTSLAMVFLLKHWK